MADYSAYQFPSVSADYNMDRLLMPRPTAAPLQKSTAIVPCTSQEWNAHRGLITRLYRDMNLPLKEVQRIMEVDHNFKATKRMYNTRLKQWNICKNYRAEEKELLAARIAQAHLENRSISDLTFKDRPVKLDRVLRHLKTKKRKNTDSKNIFKKQRLPSNNDEGSSSDSSASAFVQDDMVRVASTTRGQQQTLTPESGHTTFSLPTPSSEPDEDDGSYEIIQYDEAKLEIPEPSSPIFPPKGTLNTEVILYQTQAYYYQAMSSFDGNSLDTCHSADNAKMFWSNVKTGIYFLKKQTPTLAWPLLNDACVLAADVLPQRSLLFLNDVFTVLSPINTKVYSQVRSTMLKYLAGMASIKLKSPKHPLAVVLRELSLDNERGEASETALSFTLAFLMQNLGADHSATFAVHRSLVSLLRRDKRLEMAKQQGESLVKSSEQALFSSPNHGTDPSRQASISMADLCVALTELVHIHIDMGQYGLAKGICSSVLQNYMMIQGINFPDSRAAYAMEDMAELCSRMGDSEESIYWLREALDTSSMIRGKANATTQHIRDKLWQMTAGPEHITRDMSRLPSSVLHLDPKQRSDCLLATSARARAFWNMPGHEHNA